MTYLKLILKKIYIEDITPLLSALAKCPYIGGFVSLINATLDIYDFFVSLFKKKFQKKANSLAALLRFGGNFLLGLGKLVPLVTLAAFMVLHPCLIPVVAIFPAMTEFYKYYYIVKDERSTVQGYQTEFNHFPTSHNLLLLRESRTRLYAAKQDLAICTCLLIATLLTAIGLLFPPLITAALVISLSGAIIGYLDKKYKWSAKIYYVFNTNPKSAEDAFVKDFQELAEFKPTCVSTRCKPMCEATRFKSVRGSTHSKPIYLDNKNIPLPQSSTHLTSVNMASPIKQPKKILSTSPSNRFFLSKSKHASTFESANNTRSLQFV